MAFWQPYLNNKCVAFSSNSEFPLIRVIFDLEHNHSQVSGLIIITGLRQYLKL